MKNYALDKETSKTFIKGYNKKNNIIKVTYGDGSSRNISENYEEQVLLFMEKQVKDIGKKTKEQTEKTIVLNGGSLATMIGFGPLFMEKVLNSMGNPALNISALAVMTTIASLNVTKIAINERLAKDIDKNQFYLDNKDIFSKYNINNSKYKIEQEININTIDRLSLKQLKRIKNEIENKFTLEEKTNIRNNSLKTNISKVFTKKIK